MAQVHGTDGIWVCGGSRTALRVGVCLLLLLGGSPTYADKKAKSEKHTTISVSYGVVIDVNEEKIASSAGKGAVVGGMVGLAAGHDKSAKDARASAAAGAVLGALLTRAMEGKHKVEGFTVRKTDGTTIKIIMDHADAKAGDCVAIEEGNTSNLRRVAPQMCDSLVFHTEPAIQASHSQAAAECQTAKEAVLAAESADAVELAMQKVKVLCH